MHLAKIALDNDGSIHPLIIPSNLTNGTGLMNPSIYIDGGKILVNLRHVNYTFYHSEKKIFQHQFGPLTYVHPEHDMHLRTDNYYCELDEYFNITRFNKVDTSLFDTYEPMWDFVGLEDARLFRWNDKLYMSGVRRDTTTNGQGRMELSELEIGVNYAKEISRIRIEAPNNPDSYCEKNWMPITDVPNHYIKWGNPTEVVEVFPDTASSKTVSLGKTINLPNDLRGGSHVIPYGDLHLAITHEVYFDKSEVGRKDGKYRHRFIAWNKDWEIFAYSREFSFMDADVEFCTGMVQHENDFLISFGFQDNAAYILKVPQNVVVDFINGKY